MVSATRALAAAMAFLSIASATSLHVNKGCIIANNEGICAGNPPLYVNGATDVYACITVSGSSATSSCFFQGTIPPSWDDAYWGEDNCVYSAGSNPILVGCASNTSPQAVPNPY
ncbi:hypothetical protein B7463_g9098, partial [Scytalidium lignicola]